MLTLSTAWRPHRASPIQARASLSYREGLQQLAALLEVAEVVDLGPSTISLRLAAARGHQTSLWIDYPERLYCLVRVVQAYLEIQAAIGDETARQNLEALHLSGSTSIYQAGSESNQPVLGYPSFQLPDAEWVQWAQHYPLPTAVVSGLLGWQPQYMRWASPSQGPERLSPNLSGFLNTILEAAGDQDPARS